MKRPRNLPKTIRGTVKAGTSFPARVLDTIGGRVNVRLSDNGAIYRNLKLVGGPVDAGELVHVDFTTEEPTVVAPGKDYDKIFEDIGLRLPL